MTQPTTPPEKLDEYVTIRVGEDLKQKLAELAERNDRKMSGEGRLAIREHVERQLLEPPRVVAGDGRH